MSAVVHNPTTPMPAEEPSQSRTVALHRDLVLATDGSPAAFAATRFVSALAAQWPVTPHVLTVAPPPSMAFDPSGATVTLGSESRGATQLPGGTSARDMLWQWVVARDLCGVTGRRDRARGGAPRVGSHRRGTSPARVSRSRVPGRDSALVDAARDRAGARRHAALETVAAAHCGRDRFQSCEHCRRARGARAARQWGLTNARVRRATDRAAERRDGGVRDDLRAGRGGRVLATAPGARVAAEREHRDSGAPRKRGCPSCFRSRIVRTSTCSPWAASATALRVAHSSAASRRRSRGRLRARCW